MLSRISYSALGSKDRPPGTVWPLAGSTLSLEMSGGDASLISLPGLCPIGFPVLGADGWSPHCRQQQQGRPQGHRLGCPHVAKGSVPREELAPLMSLLSPATRRAQPLRRRQGFPKKSQQKPPRRRSDLARGPCPVLLGWGPSRPSASDRRRNNCARASCCVCRSSHPGGVSMYAGF